jgi:hypothetical protein
MNYFHDFKRACQKKGTEDSAVILHFRIVEWNASLVVTIPRKFQNAKCPKTMIVTIISVVRDFKKKSGGAPEMWQAFCKGRKKRSYGRADPNY